MKKHILIAGSILVGVGIMNVIPVKNNEGGNIKRWCNSKWCNRKQKRKNLLY